MSRIIKHDKLIYILNYENKTAAITSNDSINGNVFIPRSIKHEDHEFSINCIKEGSFKNSNKIYTIQFPPDSELQTIEREAFCSSSIIYISIPSKVTQIGEKAFFSCHNLQCVDIPVDSKLTTIEKGVFTFSLISNIYIPSHVTQICENSFTSCEKLQKVVIPSDSNLQVIEKNAFSYSSIESLSIPSSAIEFKNGWCCELPNLTNITMIEKAEKNVTYYDNKLILGKTDKTSQQFDVLLFARRDIQTATIPNSIKRISSYAFEDCNDLCKVDISVDSQLQTICEDAFSFSLIQSLIIPQCVEELKEGWCHNTPKLAKVIVMKNNRNYKNYEENEDLIIGKSDVMNDEYDILVFAGRNIKAVTIPQSIKRISSYAFAQSDIEKIIIPAQIDEIGVGAFLSCSNLQNVEFMPNAKLQIIDKDVFHSCSSIQTFYLPSNIIKICRFAFAYSSQLKNLIIEPESKLQIISKYSLYKTALESVCIPMHVKKIGKRAFCCDNLKNIEFQSNSELKTIKNEAFIFSSIENVLIPSSVSFIGKYAFANCKKLINFRFEANSELKVIGKCAFRTSNIESISIPSSVTELQNKWCDCTSQLTNVSIIPNKICNIQYYNDKYIIGKEDENNNDFDVLSFARRDIKHHIIPSFIKIVKPYSLSQSMIETIHFPPSVTKICRHSFMHCFKLRHVEFSADSNLKTIEKESFYGSSIESIVIPSSVELEKGWCSSTRELKKIVIIPNKENNIQYYDDKYILGKTDNNSSDFDFLIFARRDIEKAVIPSFIKKIGPYSFEFSCVQKVILSSNVSKIGKNSFCCCCNLRYFNIPFDSKLQKIGQNSFSVTSINRIFIPPNVRKIGSYAFDKCSHLRYVNIPCNSELQIIEAYSFNESSIEEIFIPQNVTNVCAYSFYGCNQLKKIKFSNDLNLISIGPQAFELSTITSFYIQSEKMRIANDSFNNCKIKIIEIDENTDLISYDITQFDNCLNTVIMIPIKMSCMI